MTALAEKARPGCEGLMCLPYLNGEKTPITDENARGVLFGLSYRHGPGEIARSVMEGVTFAMRDTIEICRSMGSMSLRSAPVAAARRVPFGGRFRQTSIRQTL